MAARPAPRASASRPRLPSRGPTRRLSWPRPGRLAGVLSACSERLPRIQFAVRAKMNKTPHVAIVGAGFGGLEAAEQLAHVPVEGTLIDRHNYHTFQPLLYQVAPF